MCGFLVYTSLILFHIFIISSVSLFLSFFFFGHLFQENGYQLLFLSARAISQAYHTRQFLFNLKQVTNRELMSILHFGLRKLNILDMLSASSDLISYLQDGKALPDGPVVISPDGLFPSLYREGKCFKCIVFWQL